MIPTRFLSRHRGEDAVTLSCLGDLRFPMGVLKELKDKLREVPCSGTNPNALEHVSLLKACDISKLSGNMKMTDKHLSCAFHHCFKNRVPP